MREGCARRLSRYSFDYGFGFGQTGTVWNLDRPSR
jgi:hypothetical protein